MARDKDDRSYIVSWDDQSTNVETRWTVSRARDSYGYNICTLWQDGERIARCDGGGYDMVGTVFGVFIAKQFADRLRERITSMHYGLRFIDPTYDPGKAKIAHDFYGDPAPERTVEEAEAAGESLGLDRYQAAYAASSDLPTATHTVPRIDGGCGMSSVERIAQTIGVTIRTVH